MNPFCLLVLSFLQRTLALLCVEEELEVYLHIETYFFIVGALIFFCLGQLIGGRLYKTQDGELIRNKKFYVNKIIFLIYMLAGIGALYFCYHYISSWAMLFVGGTNVNIGDVMGNA